MKSTPGVMAGNFESITVTMAPVILLAAFHSMRKFPPARHFALAWSVLLVGTVIYAAVALGLLPKMPITE